ncbi:MAG: beta-propeller domain-containing protein [Rubrivivax sp.]|nr:beta-propeller domain-containing protein [Rubrivivax sp.]
MSGALLLAACGGGGGSEAPPPAQAQSGLQAAGPGELLAQARALVRQRLDLRAQSAAALIDRDVSLVPLGATSAAADAGTVAPAFSGTLVQEPGVDEPDLLKTDGRVLYALDTYGLRSAGSPRTPHQILVAQAGADGRVTPLQALALPQDDTQPSPRGLLLAPEARRLAALSEHFTPVAMPQPCPPGMACITGSLIWPGPALRSHVQVQTADVAGPGTLSLGRRIDIEGRLVNSRRVGQTLYLLTSHSPRVAADQLPGTASVAEREAALAAMSAADLLPRQRIDGGAWQPLLNESDCLLQPANSSASLTLTTLVAIDLGSPTLARQARCFLGGTDALYLSPSHLYLATSRSAPPRLLADGRLEYSPDHLTDIHRFAFSGLDIRYRASGQVNGHLGWDAQRMALRLSEHNGDLRVISFTGRWGWAMPADATDGTSRPPSPATLTVLREDSAARTLAVVSTLPNSRRPASLGKPDEQLYGVRFDGARAYLVTFRQIDPLYVLDLADPADPRIAGELEIPGFSDSLLPLGDGLLLGVGREVGAQGQWQGVKLALFDVRDASRPALLRSMVLGARGSSTALDFSTHGLNVHRVGSQIRLALPMSLTLSDESVQPEQALHRFNVDALARTLNPRPALGAPPGSNGWDLWGDRSLQIGDAVFYLSQGSLRGAPW